MKMDEEAYVASFKTELMDAVYQWCKGAKFSEICKVRAICYSLRGGSERSIQYYR